MRVMDQGSATAKNRTLVQGTAVCSCELRLERYTRDTDGTERIEFLCGAAGGPEHGYILGVAGEDLASLTALCNACPIPDALESQRSCLNLVPVRRFSAGKRNLPVLQPPVRASDSREPGEPVDAYFPCRWFYSLYGQNQPHDTSFCQSCPHWFPRPPRERIPDYWPATQKMLRVVNGEESAARSATGFTPASRQPPARTWWQRLLQKVHL
jgi:hypothetical protein